MKLFKEFLVGLLRYLIVDIFIFGTVLIGFMCVSLGFSLDWKFSADFVSCAWFLSVLILTSIIFIDMYLKNSK